MAIGRYVARTGKGNYQGARRRTVRRVSQLRPALVTTLSDKPMRDSKRRRRWLREQLGDVLELALRAKAVGGLDIPPHEIDQEFRRAWRWLDRTCDLAPPKK